MAIYYFPTNKATDWTDPLAFCNVAYWGSPVRSNSVTNTAFATMTHVANTSQTFDIVFSHDSGNTNIYLDNLSVSEWYADTKTNGGWIASDSWIEPSLKSGMGNCCRFDPSRASPGTNQYIQTPLLTNGLLAFALQYCGGTTNPVSFEVLISHGDPNVFTDKLVSVTNRFNGSGSDYVIYGSQKILDLSTNIYLRFKSTTPAPGILLMDAFDIAPCLVGDTWDINNAAINANPQTYPPGLCQFFGGACYLNSNRTSNVSTNPVDRPDISEMPYVRTPSINGVGEISFWYRNWATSGVVTPARLLVQSAPADAPTNWTTLFTVNNVVNTNDYLFFQSSLYNTTCSLIRICNDDTYTSTVGRVCLDDILVTTPMACSLALSNLVITPPVPLFSDTVNVAADVYHLFLSPTNVSLTAWYGTATNYAGLSTAAVVALPMTCIASNLAAPGRWYRYQTMAPIPSNTIDTFVKYYVSASFDGIHSEVTSPVMHNQFAVVPSWYYPLDALCGTSMAYYIVYSCPTGSVWFNEINYIDQSPGSTTWTNEYVELCGPAGANIRNWRTEILDETGAILASYLITNVFILPDATNGYGFRVLGDIGVPGVAQLLTNTIPDGFMGQNLPRVGGMRLTRSSGIYADRVMYGRDLGWPGFTYIGTDMSTGAVSMALAGDGSNPSQFYWAWSPCTPGSANTWQTFPVQSGENAPPSVLIVAFWVDSNVWIECASTSQWSVTPLYSTNLLDTNSWTGVVPFWTTYPSLSPSNTYTVHFDKPTNSGPYFYTITATNAP